MKIKLLLILFIGIEFGSHAQQNAQFTQYMYNTITINPAYAGSRELISIFGLYRTQWVGLDGAPVTSTFSVDTPLGSSRVGLGISLTNDKIGSTQVNVIAADLSYTIPVSETFKLSFGSKITANLFSLDASNLKLTHANDPNLQSYSTFNPNIGAGLYLHSDNAYLGLSVPSFIETQYYSDNDNDYAIYKEKINYYAIVGYVFDISEDIKFKPALLTKMVKGAPLQLDVSGNFMFYDKLVMGLSYRWSAALSAMVGFQVSEGLYLGYGYDYETTELNHYNSGSHEVFLRYELFTKYNKIGSPRFF